MPPPDDFQLGEDRPRTVHSSSKQRQERNTNTQNMTQRPDEFYGDGDFA